MNTEKELTPSQLHELSRLSKDMLETARTQLKKWHAKYMKPKNDAELAIAKNNMDYWQEKEFEAMDALAQCQEAVCKGCKTPTEATEAKYVKITGTNHYDNGQPKCPDSFSMRNRGRVFAVVAQDECQIVVEGGWIFGVSEEGETFVFVDAKEYLPTYVDNPRNSAEIVQKGDGKALVTAHRVSFGDVMNLTMGSFVSMHHIEYCLTCFLDGQLRITETRVNNNHTRTNSSSRPYNPNHYPPEYRHMLDDLEREARAHPYIHPNSR